MTFCGTERFVTEEENEVRFLKFHLLHGGRVVDRADETGVGDYATLGSDTPKKFAGLAGE